MSKYEIAFPMQRSDIIAMLKHYRISPTRQRLEIAEFLFSQPQHLSADKILDGVKEAGNRVSRATVYNTMGLFAAKGVVREVLIDRERVFYDSNIEPHYHLYNVDTGHLTDIDDVDVDVHVAGDLPEGARVIDTDVVIKVSTAEAP